MYIGGFGCKEENDVKFGSSYCLNLDRVFSPQMWEPG